MVGLIRFAGFADTSCPLTFDHANLSTITQNIEIVKTQEEDGTAIGEALTLAVSRLQETKAENKIIVLQNNDFILRFRLLQSTHRKCQRFSDGRAIFFLSLYDLYILSNGR